MDKHEQESVTQNDNNEMAQDRRDFLKNAVLATGAVAAVGAATTASAAIDPEKGEPLAHAKTYHAAFDARYRYKIHSDHIHKVLDQLLNAAGCPSCGLVGHDIRLSLDPIIRVQSDIPVNVAVNAGH